MPDEAVSQQRGNFSCNAEANVNHADTVLPGNVPRATLQHG